MSGLDPTQAGAERQAVRVAIAQVRRDLARLEWYSSYRMRWQHAELQGFRRAAETLDRLEQEIDVQG